MAMARGRGFRRQYATHRARPVGGSFASETTANGRLPQLLLGIVPDYAREETGIGGGASSLHVLPQQLDVWGAPHVSTCRQDGGRWPSCRAIRVSAQSPPLSAVRATRG